MIKVQELKNTDGNSNSYKVSAFADTKEEVDAGGTFEGLPEGADMELGSTVVTAKGDLGFMQSNGTWNWLSASGGGGQGSGNIIVVTDLDEIPEPSEELAGKVCLFAAGVVIPEGTVSNAVWMVCGQAGLDDEYTWIPLPGSGMPELYPMFGGEYPGCSVELTTKSWDGVFQQGHRYQRIPAIFENDGTPIAYCWMDTDVANDGDGIDRPDEFPKLVGMSVGHIYEGQLANITLRFSKFITTELDDQLTKTDNISETLRCTSSHIEGLIGGFVNSLPHSVDGKELDWSVRLDGVMLNSANVFMEDNQTQHRIVKPIAMTDVTAYIEHEFGDIAEISDSGVELHIDRTTHDYDYAILCGTVEFLISLIVDEGK